MIKEFMRCKQDPEKEKISMHKQWYGASSASGFKRSMHKQNLTWYGASEIKNAGYPL